MLPSSYRINKAYFKEIFKKGSYFSNENFQLIILKSSELTSKNSKFAFSVSQKASKNAVERNKLRRRGYSIISKLLDKLNSGHLAVFILKKTARNLSFEEYKKEIENLLQKSSLLRL